MAGHSQFKNIMYRKGAQDAKRGRMFTKIMREILVAAREGGIDPEINARLRTALINARGANMSKDTIEKALKRVAGGEEQGHYEEMRYEGFGAHGVAFVIEALTDNRNRSASELRFILSRHGGALGETNSVTFLFDRLGLFLYPTTVDQDALFSEAIDAEAMDIQVDEDGIRVLCAFEDFASMRERLIGAFGDPLVARIVWQPKAAVQLADTAQEDSLMELVHALEENDDVQSVWHNAEIVHVQNIVDT